VIFIRILNGIDNIRQIDGFLKGKRLGFAGGPASVSRGLTGAAEILAENYRLAALFAPEHGIRGDMEAGVKVNSYTDTNLGVPVYGIYGGKNRPAPKMLEDIDVMAVDLQEVSVRFYTFLYTLANIMEACAEKGVPVVVLDRITPLGGETVAGTICEPAFDSFVGGYGLPARTGLTIGEFARYINEFADINCDLTVVPVTGWKRSLYFDETGLQWVPPSPNLPTADSCFAYAGTCIFEGTNVSEGRGTAKPFEFIGAPWLDTDKLVKNMAERGIPGAVLRKAYFAPTFDKYKNKLCNAVQIHVTGRTICEPFRLGLLLLEEIWKLHPDKLEFIPNGKNGNTYYIDNLLGTDAFRLKRHDAESLISAHAPGIEKFRETKMKYHFYE